jgi:hypothetical protein
MLTAVQAFIWQMCLVFLIPSTTWAASGSRFLVAQSGISVQSRSYTIEVLIVAVLVAAVLFVICRSSRRS